MAGLQLLRMLWLGPKRGTAADWLTQRWVQLTGRRIRLADAPWLAGPTGGVDGIRADFFERWAADQGLSIAPTPDRAGLLELECLAGPSFDPARVDPLIHRFYRDTASFELRLGVHWSRAFRVLGWAVTRIFARRLAQLNVPLTGQEVEAGVTSRVLPLRERSGQIERVGWVRASKQTGHPVFVGQYGTARAADSAEAYVQVVFPLPNGNAIVLLRPCVDAGGGLTLRSEGRDFGGPGFYFTVVAGHGEVWARKVRTMRESLHLRVEGTTIEAVHRFFVFGAEFLQLTYRIAPAPAKSSDEGAGVGELPGSPTAAARERG